VQIRDVKDDYDVVTDYLIGDLYFTVYGGKIYGLFFTAERAEYRLCQIEIENMLATVKFPGQEKAKGSAVVQEDSTTDVDK
ncbi:hypothetical protein ACFLQW_04395, partial [Candidatus Zixiibacteriota bacterium]